MIGSRKREPGYLLIVDGNANELIYTSMLVQRFGYNSCTAASGKEALEMVKNAMPILIISVHELPDMSGLDLLRQVKRRVRPGSIQVIIKRRPMSPGDEQKYGKAGVTRFLTYPEAAEALFRAIQGTIEQTPRSTIRVRTRLPILMGGSQLD